MNIEPSKSTIGAIVTDIDLRDAPGTALAEEVRAALADRGVLIFRDQKLEDESQIEVGSIWAEVAPHPIIEFLGGTELIGVVFNDENHPPAGSGDSNFHTDYSFNIEIPDVAVLRPIDIPPYGGGTGWADTREALARLRPELRKRIAGLRAHHSMGSRFAHEMEVRMGAETAARLVERFDAGNDHPVISKHPHTGDPLLFVNPGFTKHIVGTDADESEALLAELYEAFHDPEIQFEQAWQPGDVAIWDEHRTVHRGPTDFGTNRRVLRRCTAGKRVPVAAS